MIPLHSFIQLRCPHHRHTKLLNSTSKVSRNQTIKMMSIAATKRWCWIRRLICPCPGHTRFLSDLANRMMETTGFKVPFLHLTAINSNNKVDCAMIVFTATIIPANRTTQHLQELRPEVTSLFLLMHPMVVTARPLLLLLQRRGMRFVDCGQPSPNTNSCWRLCCMLVGFSMANNFAND